MKNSVDMPSLEEMQLGPYSISIFSGDTVSTCGCLLYHRHQLSFKLGMNEREDDVFRTALVEACGGIEKYRALARLTARNNLANRKKAMRALEEAMDTVGFDVK